MALEKKKSKDLVTLIDNKDSSEKQSESTDTNTPFLVGASDGDSAEKETVIMKNTTTPEIVPEPRVKIILKTNHSCVIGGIHYHFEKGKSYNVPLNVKLILKQCDLLAPL